MAKTIYVQLTDNKAIKNYSTNPQDGYIAATIQDADAYSLAEYYNLMWVDDGNLVHAENTPATEYQKDINQTKAIIAQSQQQVAAELQSIQTKIDAANQANTQLDAKLTAINAAVDNATKLTAGMQVTFAKELSALAAKSAETSK